jgi:hypothetical protein
MYIEQICCGVQACLSPNATLRGRPHMIHILHSYSMVRKDDVMMLLLLLMMMLMMEMMRFYE